MAEIRVVKGGSNNYSIKDAKVRKFMWFVAGMAAVGGFLFGFDTGVISGALSFIEGAFKPTVLQISMIVSATVLGAFFGCITSGVLTNKFGRRMTLIYCSLTFIVGTLMCAFANNTEVLTVGRFILGVAIGIASYTVPLYIAEISVPEKRGTMVMLNGVAITGAQAISFLSDYYFTQSGNWRMMLGVAIIPALILLLGAFFLPDSPRWLMMKCRKAQAVAILGKIRDADRVQPEIQEIEESFKIQHGGYRELFSKTARPVLIIGLALGILQQFVGINTVMYYGPYIFKNVGLSGASAEILATFGMGLVNFFATIFVMFTVDRWGRKKLMLNGMLVAFASLMILGYLSYNADAQVSELSKVMSVVLMVTYIAGYAVSIGSLFWLIISEIYPLKIRSIGMSFVSGIQWLANFVVSMTFLPILSVFGIAAAFWLYGGMCLVVILFTKFYVPETKGVSLETIEKNLENGHPVLELGHEVQATI
ncbi:MAG: sugar porter family MFS transporter [Bacillota bacterium]